MILCGVDIGGTKITVSLASIEGIIIKLYQKVKLKGDNKTIPNQVIDLIKYAMKEKNISRINAIGVSTCSPFKKIGDYKVVVAPNLCGVSNDWSSIPLEEELNIAFPETNIVIGNDCVTAVVAERTFGAGIDEDDVLYVTWSTGVGTGAYVTGIDAITGEERVFLISGKNGNAPHGGHMYINLDGPKCGCGNYGDLESLTSGKNINAKELFERKDMDEIKKVARIFAKGLAAFNSILDTKIIIIGGSVFMNNKEILLPLLREEFYKSFPALSKETMIVPSELDSYLGDIAALSQVIPKEWIKIWQEKKPWTNAPKSIILT